MKRATVALTYTKRKLKDEDFADDIAVLSHNLNGIQEKTAIVETAAGHVGFKIGHAKSQDTEDKRQSRRTC